MTRPSEKDFTDERSMLLAFLDFHRKLARHRVAGLSDDQARARLVPSATTPAGVISHLAAVERYWFRRQLDGEDWRAPWSKDDPDADWRVDGRTVAEITGDYKTAINESNAIISRYQLDDHAAREHHGNPPVTLRWILLHMIAETAQHNGHLDILCEQISAAVPVAATGV